MRILITGGSGLIGKATTQRLVSKGHTVRVVDLKSGPDMPGVEYALVDTTDYKALREAVRGCQAAVHLAALVYPAAGPGEEIFRINASGTFNLFQAAAEEGIQRVVQASSINALGLYYGVKPADPLYFPIDEDHPSVTTDPYSFSKTVAEEVGRYYWRREGISSIALRLPATLPPEILERMIERQSLIQQVSQRLLRMSQEDRLQAVEEMVSKFDEYRRQRLHEKPGVGNRMWGPGLPIDEETFYIMVGRNNFWAILDVRDAAQAIEKSLTASFEGSHPLFVNNAANSAGIEAETLVSLFFPRVKTRKRPLTGIKALVSIEQARKLIGFEPEYSL